MRFYPLLAIALVVLTAIAAYNVYVNASAHPSVRVTTVVARVADSGGFSYLAYLAPNPLYNNTTVVGGNQTFFVAWTRSFNATVEYAASADRLLNFTVTSHSQVVLWTPAWAKTLSQGSRDASLVDSEGGAWSTNFSFNVSQALSEAGVIDNASQYTPPEIGVAFLESVEVAAGLGSMRTSLDLHPTLNFTISGGEIHAGLADYTGTGNLTGVGYAATSPSAPTVELGWLFLAASGLVLTIVVTGPLRRRAPASPDADLAALTRELEEFIVDTRSLPRGPTSIEVASWGDLVRVADLRAQPILRYTPGGGDSTGRSFYVRDGAISYELPPRSASAPPTGGGPTVGTEGAAPTVSPATAVLREASPAPAARVGANGPVTAPAAAPIPTVAPTKDALVARCVLLTRLAHHLPSHDPRRLTLSWGLTKVMGRIREGDLPTADALLVRLETGSDWID
jgi:hypothetical protein